METTNRPDVTFGPKQLVFLTMIAVMAAVVVFLCGVQVGRGVGAREAGRVGSGVAVAQGGGGAGLAGAARLPEDEDPAGSRIDGLSYFERLRGGGPVPEALDFGDTRAGRAEPEPDAFRGTGAGSFVVQVMSVRGSAAAEGVKAGLEAKGYPVVIEPRRRSPGALHRVRVGPYADRAEAELVSHRLRTEERFRPWVTQP